MAARMFKISSNQPGSSPVRVAAGGTDYDWISGGIDAGTFGTPSIQPRYSDPSELDEFNKLGESAQLRSFPIQVQIQGTSAADLQNKILALTEVAKDITRWGGKIRYRGDNMDYPVDLIAVDVDIDDAKGLHSHVAELMRRQTVVMRFTVQPWAYPAPLRVADQFTTDTFGTGGIYNDDGPDWTSVASIALPAVNISTSFTIIDGRAVTTGGATTTERRVIHTGTQWKYSEPYVRATFYRPSSGAAQKYGVLLKWIDKDNYIEACISGSTGSFVVTVDVIQAGVRTTRYSVAPPSQPGRRFRFSAMIRGNNIYATMDTSVTPTESLGAGPAWRYRMTTGEAAVFGAGQKGRSGVVILPASNNVADFGDFESIDFAMQSNGEVQGLPQNRWASAPIPANASPIFRLHTANVRRELMFGWWDRRRALNLYPKASGTQRWTSAAITGIQTSAGTAITNPTDANNASSRSSSLPLQMGATTGLGTDGGGSLLVLGRIFLKGVTYKARAKAMRTSGAGSIRMKMGAVGDLAVGSAVAISSTGVFDDLIEVEWTPAQDTYGCYVSVTTSSSVTISWEIAEIKIWETTNITEPAIGSGGFNIYGMIGGSGFSSATGFALTTDVDSAYGNGFCYAGAVAAPTLQMAAAVTSGSATYSLTSAAVDEPDGECVVDVFSLVQIAQASTAVTIKASWRSYESGDGDSFLALQPLEPFGSAGKVALLPTSGYVKRLIYLGRFAVPAGSTQQHELQIDVTKGAAGIFVLEGLLCMPAKHSAGTPTGVEYDSTVPNYSRQIMEANLDVKFPGGGLVSAPARYGGSPLKLESGQRIEMVTWNGITPIDTTTPSAPTLATNAASPDNSSRTNVEVQPRYFMLEGAGQS